MRDRSLRAAPAAWVRRILLLMAVPGACLAGVATPARAMNHPPVFTSVPPTQSTAGVAWRYQVGVADPDRGDAPTLTVVQKPAWMGLIRRGGRAAYLTGTPSLAAVGTHAVRLRATDRYGARAIQHFVVTVVAPVAATPVMTPAGGTFAGPVAVTIVAPTPGSSIRYTTDGSEPSESEGGTYDSPVTLRTLTGLKAIAFGPGLGPSSVASASFRFAPGVETQPVEALGSDRGTLRGAVDPRGLSTRAWFEWGTDPLLRAPRTTERVPVGDGAAPVDLSRVLQALDAGTTYYFRVVAENEAGIARGAIDYFAPDPPDNAAILVNCAEDLESAPPGKMTLRAAIDRLASGGTITFDPSLDGRRIDLEIVGEESATLLGEVFQFAAGKWEFMGFQERNYGRTALYARKNVIIDAAALPAGITIAWAGGEANPARVLAVFGNLRLRNVTVTGGVSVAVELPGNPQRWTLARGGGVAVWGIASLEGCTIAGNRAVGDVAPSRDRGAFGGGVYADWVFVSDSVVSGNAVSGFGAAGGGIYSVGGTDYAVMMDWQEPLYDGLGSRVMRTTVSGNRVTAQHAYGGGIYSDGGGPGNLMTLQIEESTLARNLVEDHPGIAQSAMMQYYYRGGGAYMSNGYLWIHASTIAENDVTGVFAQFSGKPNMGGGGIAATIGNAHVVEDMTLWHAIIAGNRVGGAPQDVFTGSLLHFYSSGYNLVGAMDFTWMLAPIPEWMCLSRRHWPQEGDAEGVSAAAVLDLEGAALSATTVSAGTDAGSPALLWYPPLGDALDRIPPESYPVHYVEAGYSPYFSEPDPTDDFLNHVLAQLRRPEWLGADFAPQFGDMSGIPFVAEGGSWPSLPENAAWIQFWRDLDAAIGDRLGAVRLGDAFWVSFDPQPWSYNVIDLDGTTSLTINYVETYEMWRNTFDQLGAGRTTTANSDIGAIEVP